MVLHIGKGDLVTYVALVTVAVLEAAEPFRKEAAMPPEAHPFWASPAWQFIPIVLLALVAVIWGYRQIFPRMPSHAPAAAEPAPLKSPTLASAPQDPATIPTAPADVGRKLGIIDQLRSIMTSEVEPMLNRGGNLNGWKNHLHEDGRQVYMKALSDYEQQWIGIENKIIRIREDAGYTDLSLILEPTYQQAFRSGLSALRGAIGAMGDPPYTFDQDYFVNPSSQKFFDGLQALTQWQSRVERALLAKRQQISG